MSTPETMNLGYLRFLKIFGAYHHPCWPSSFRHIVIIDLLSVKLLGHPYIYGSFSDFIAK
jgi:hypothetical protein